jgi:DNA-binding transcriptional ArsR family regulator
VNEPRLVVLTPMQRRVLGELTRDGASNKVSRYEWERWLRRCVLPASTKLVGFVMATYAARDGSRIFPGVARLAATTGLSERTVRTALGNLRDVGLIERVYPGGRRGQMAFADVHRLAVPDDLMQRVEMLDPEEDALPKRQPLPPGKPVKPNPNRQMSASQPATDDVQPATDDVPTGNGCTPTTHRSLHRSDQPSTEGSPFGTQPTTGGAEVPTNVIAGRFGRRGA